MSMLDLASLGAVLGVWAHPDDEAFLAAGLTARLTDAGAHVAVLTATRGEHGTADPTAWPAHRLGRRRGHELRASLAVVGVTDHTFLGYEDGTLDAVPDDEGAAHVTAALARVSPDTVVTFGPEGMTGHTDHIAVSRWVDRAVASHPDPVRVLHATTTEVFVARWGPMMRDAGAYMRDDLPLATPMDQVAFEAHLDEDEQDRKIVALAAQSSQLTGMLAGLGEATVAAAFATESFTLAPSARPAAAAGAAGAGR